MNEPVTQPCPRDPLFGDEGEVLYRDLSDRLYDAPGRWDVRRNDGLLWLDPRPEHASLHLLYQRYYTHGDAGVAVPGGLVAALYHGTIGRLSYMKDRARLERMYLDEGQGRRVLDVGCGDGARLALLREAGWQVTGQEVDSAAVAEARRRWNLNVLEGELTQLDLPAEGFDAVIMNHVIEHLHDPLAVLRRCLKLVKPGGEFITATPNADAFGRRAFDADWLHLDPPRHLQIFTGDALQRLAREAGFTQSRVFTSCARAQAVGRGSLDIRQKPIGIRRWVHDVRALTFQWRACMHHRHHPDCGEELILRAKP